MVQWNTEKKYAHGGPSLCLKGSILFLEIVYFLFLGKQRSCDGGHTAPVCCVHEPKKMGARSARARTCGHNPLVQSYICKSVDDNEKPKTQEYTNIFWFQTAVDYTSSANCLAKAKATNVANKLTGLLLHALLLIIFTLIFNKKLEYVSEHLCVNTVHICKILYLHILVYCIHCTVKKGSRFSHP